jgi:4-amino-4-deoxy-L-arabinose transferase-like glycosyltransferase
MKKYLAVIALLALIKLIIQLLGNRHYGFHRDELLHLSAAEHLDWGFMEFPPFVALMGKLSDILFDFSLMGTRLLPTLAGIGLLVLVCLMAKEFGGKRYAVILAGIAVLAFLPYYRNHSLFQPVAFDQLFWALGFYFLIKFINSNNKNYLLLAGASLGIGLMNKYTMLLWGFAVFVGLLFHQKGKLFKNKWLYISGGLGLLIFLPNIIWQIQHDVPFLRHMQQLQASQLSGLGSYAFLLDQISMPFTFVLAVFGGVWLGGRPLFRWLGIAALVLFFSMWLLQAKSYYFFSLYAPLFAAGAVATAQFLENKHRLFKIIVPAVLLLYAIPVIPRLTPILPIDMYLEYRDLPAEGRVELTGDYADMFGWEEQVQLVDSVYRSLNQREFWLRKQ